MQPSILVEEKLSFFPGSCRSLIVPCLLLVFGGGGWSGCVSSEKYEAEKARSLNFQRLLAQEEKRTGELNVKYQEAQRKASDMESQNRDLSTELRALRDQLDRTQAELTRAREGGISDQPSTGSDLALGEPSISEFGLTDLEFKDADLGNLGSDLGGGLKDDKAAGMGADLGGGFGGDMQVDLGLEPSGGTAVGSNTYHTVARGETLFAISRRYGVTVRDLKNWNNLHSDLIHPGQKLIVRSP